VAVPLAKLSNSGSNPAALPIKSKNKKKHFMDWLFAPLLDYKREHKWHIKKREVNADCI
jgi:hypothetical protein